MTHREALALIDTPYLRSKTPTRWADLGCGSGTFTLALADLLAPGSTIEAIDLEPTIRAQTTNKNVTIHPRTADFTKLDLSAFDGILMANSLHYVKDQRHFLSRLQGTLLLVEYDTDRPVPRWVPYPLSYNNAVTLLAATGHPNIQKLGTHPSAFGRSELYAALALPQRDPSTISPSAYALLKMKSVTSIPYVREAAALLDTQGANKPIDTHNLETNVDPINYWGRVLHFESRYSQVDQLLAGLTAADLTPEGLTAEGLTAADLTATNILEISSGFSFRGLALSEKKPVYYIDTDLPNIIAGKHRLIDAFRNTRAGATANIPAIPGHYELLPLNALDPAAFQAAVDRFPPGPLTIVNEGLLVYLDEKEKEQLCQNIKKALQSKGGHWITADIYIRRPEEEQEKQDDPWRQWSQEHGLEEKKFASFSEAEAFFDRMGFKKEKEAQPDYSRLTSLSHFIKAMGTQGLDTLRRRSGPRLHATWQLALK